MELDGIAKATMSGSPSWEVPLGRRDSKSASLSGSNNNIPTPNNSFQTILTKFKQQGLDIVESGCPLPGVNGSSLVINRSCTVLSLMHTML
ncbi:hypothetical protein SO802_005638 [Lithocarpus litseifolius]|uniref:peroxidase n=1 Tax=Lithocarpus litseifolius TaxID=425828 RepID=A0AAW2DIP7_9ROSI